ncbi:MAG: hypothetical protein A2Y17_04330 [Clostridiales bacterium GWF2_38_85]|nr:MAG: hypothetical protein A2Y17_04330 [Clostridiales bacterium GWF2_38_85]HBL83421.1 hypothetical protein [Clostridiales bacterium]
MDDFLQLLMPLIVVILVIIAAYFTTRWIAKKQNSFTSGKIIKVIERVMLSKDVFLAVVQVDSKNYLMSISSGKTELLTELDETVVERYKTNGQTGDFMSIFMSALNGKHGNKVSDERNNKEK